MLRFLLKSMQHIHCFLQPDRVNGTEGVPGMIGDNFQDAARKTSQRFRIRVPVADLRLVHRIPDVALDRLRESAQNPV